jgi:hypothetical protein
VVMMSRRFVSRAKRRTHRIGGPILAAALIILLSVRGHADDSGAPAYYTVAPHGSMVQIYVYRAGLLAFAGHDHIVSTSVIDGKLSYTPPPALAAAFHLSIPVDDLVVDDPEQRQAAGGRFGTVVPDKDRAGTRRNMLGDHVLAAARFPQITVDGHWLHGSLSHGTVAVTVGIRSTRRDYQLPVDIRVDHNRVLVTGAFHPLQTELGITPFSALAGALKVADRLDVRFKLVFVPLAGAGQPSSR